MKSPAERKTAPRNDVRLLPAVAGVAAILFCLKAGGLAFEASAATAPAPAAAAKAADEHKAPVPSAPTPAAPAAQADPLAAINAAMPMQANKPPVAAGDVAAPASPAASDTGVSQAEMDVLEAVSREAEAPPAAPAPPDHDPKARRRQAIERTIDRLEEFLAAVRRA